jgi:hypothetical protein
MDSHVCRNLCTGLSTAGVDVVDVFASMAMFGYSSKRDLTVKVL